MAILGFVLLRAGLFLIHHSAKQNIDAQKFYKNESWFYTLSVKSALVLILADSYCLKNRIEHGQ